MKIKIEDILEELREYKGFKLVKESSYRNGLSGEEWLHNHYATFTYTIEALGQTIERKGGLGAWKSFKAIDPLNPSGLEGGFATKEELILAIDKYGEEVIKSVQDDAMSMYYDIIKIATMTYELTGKKEHEAITDRIYERYKKARKENE